MQIEEKGECKLFGSFGIVVQVILGGISFLVLVLKRILENPKRSWKVWALVWKYFTYYVGCIQTNIFCSIGSFLESIPCSAFEQRKHK